jgi:MFS family permease
VLGLDALTFLVVVPVALRLPAPPRDTGARFRPSFARDARDGLAFIWRTPSVLAIALGFWVVVLFSAPDDLILPFLATLTFRAGPVAVGVLLAAASAGLLAGLPFVTPAGRRLGVTRAIVAGFAIMATGNLLTAAAPWLMAVFAAQMLRGLAIPLADTHVTTSLQRTTPPQLLGRVLANVYGGVGVAAAAGYLLGGAVVEATSPRTALVMVGCGGLAGVATTAVLLRKARRQPETGSRQRHRPARRMRTPQRRPRRSPDRRRILRPAPTPARNLNTVGHSDQALWAASDAEEPNSIAAHSTSAGVCAVIDQASRS